MGKTYKIDAGARELNLKITNWEKRLYLEMDGSYGTIGYYDIVAGQVVATTKDWDKMDRKCPEIKEQIVKAISDFQVAV